MTSSIDKQFPELERAKNLRRSFDVRLDDETHESIESIRAGLGVSKSELIRRAIRIMQAAESLKSNDLEVIVGEVPDSSNASVVVTRKSPKRKIESDTAALLQMPVPPIELNAKDKLELSKLSLTTASLIVPKKSVIDGTLIVANRIAWNAMVDVLKRDWQQAYQIPPSVFEELIAGAFERAGYDDVVLTPRSGDHGRDVIAYKHGIGSIRIIGSVKRYAEHRPVNYDDIRALLGVMGSEPETSKGMVVTTSKFPPELRNERAIQQYVPTRLELLDGKALLRWLTHLRGS